MNSENKKTSFLFKKLNLVFVYFCIFIVGLVIVFIMTSYLNNKVKEFNTELIVDVQK